MTANNSNTTYMRRQKGEALKDSLTTELWRPSIDAWMAWQKVSGKPRSTLSVRHVQIRRLAHAFPDVSPWDLSVDDLAGWMATNNWKPETLASYRTAFRTFWQWGVVTGRTARDVAVLLPAIRIPATRPRPAPEDVVNRARSTADSRVSLMVQLAAEAGLRCSEIAALHSRDLVEDCTGWSLRIVGKGGVIRMIPLTPRLALELQSRPAGRFFPGRGREHISAPYVSQLLSEHLDGHWTGHTLRHRFATVAYSAERDLRAVQELLGHADPQTTARYAAVPDGAKRAAVLAASS